MCARRSMYINIIKSHHYKSKLHPWARFGSLVCSSGSRNFGEGGQETWNISRRAWWPSFFGLFSTGRGGGAWLPWPPPPWIRYWFGRKLWTVNGRYSSQTQVCVKSADFLYCKRCHLDEGVLSFSVIWFWQCRHPIQQKSRY